MSGKISWLDSTRAESTIHITSDDSVTLCGYPFISNFADDRWVAYKVSKKRGICKICLKIALQKHIKFKNWSSTVPERDITKIPVRTNWRKPFNTRMND